MCISGREKKREFWNIITVFTTYNHSLACLLDIKISAYLPTKHGTFGLVPISHKDWSNSKQMWSALKICKTAFSARQSGMWCRYNKSKPRIKVKQKHFVAEYQKAIDFVTLCGVLVKNQSIKLNKIKLNISNKKHFCG